MEKNWKKLLAISVAGVGTFLGSQAYANDPLQVKDWDEIFNPYGDFRFRYEYFNSSDVSSYPVRHRFRIRARMGLNVKMTEWSSLHFRLATAESEDSNGNGDPVSTNQSLTSCFSKKNWKLDQAYVTLHHECVDWLKLHFGKVDQFIWEPNFASPMLYDTDLTPEGAVQQFHYKFDECFTFFANTAQYVCEEFKSSVKDSYFFDFQAGVKADWDCVRATFAVNYYSQSHLEQVAFASGADLGNANSGSNYYGNYRVISFFPEVYWRVCDEMFMCTPAVFVFSGAYIHNTNDQFEDGTQLANGDAGNVGSDLTDGYTFQVAFGEAKECGSWEVIGQYKRLEADATFDRITDSDWGYGGTDRKGWVLYGKYQVQKWWRVQAKAFWTEKLSSRTSSNAIPGDGDTLTRFQLDNIFKY